MILSLDISTTATGYCVIDKSKIITHGVITHKDKGYLNRSQVMADFIKELVHTFQITHAVIESLVVHKNHDTLVKLAITQGIIIRELKDIEIEHVSPPVWRKYHRIPKERDKAKKKAISLCRVRGIIPKTDDEAEAILIGLWYINKPNINRKVGFNSFSFKTVDN